MIYGRIIAESNLDKETKIGDLIYRVKAGIEGKKNGLDVSEVRKEFIDLGIMDERETKGQQYLKLFKTLKRNGVKIEEINTMVGTIKDIEQEGIDIEKIIEENQLDGNLKIGSIIQRIRGGIRGANPKNAIKLTEKEKEEFVKLGVYQPTRLEELEETKKELQAREKQAKEKETESEKLKKKYQLELEKKEGRSIE